MNPEAVEFFENSGVLMTYLMDPMKQPIRLKDAQVKAGAESYFDKIKLGEIKARPNQYAAGVWHEAGKVKYKQFLKDNEILEHHKKIIKALDITISRLKVRRWFWLLLGVVLGYVAADYMEIYEVLTWLL